ncbi:MAG: hypothetical protein K2H60_00350 [Muribaculaceae bacterium]|nr:hypothetical protein [Muribaculaceae bacterium]
MAKQENLLDQHIGEIADIIDDLDDRFDSHDFIIMLSETIPEVYNKILDKHHNNVSTACGEISRWLSTHTSKLEIERIVSSSSEVHVSENILGNESSCAQWHKIE